MPDIHLTFGRKIKSSRDETYSIIQPVGKGGNCGVFLAVCLSGENQGNLFAIKVFAKLYDEERKSQFLQEAEFLGECDHPSIVRVFDTGEVRISGDSRSNLHPFVVMDYYPATLRESLSPRLMLPQRSIFVLQLLSALQKLQSDSRQIVHRDIKPENIFVRGNQCALGDFGLMKVKGAELCRNKDEPLKQSALPGMPYHYRTPDLVGYAKNENDVTCTSDIFQLGLVAAELFVGRNPLRKAKNVLDPVDVCLPPELAGGFGPLILDTIRTMLEEEPRNRASIEDLLDSWQGVLDRIASHYAQADAVVFR